MMSVVGRLKLNAAAKLVFVSLNALQVASAG
jgi:hypothetical protein